MTGPDIDVRLDRIDQKLEKLADAVERLARVEERQSQQRETIQRVWEAIENQGERLAVLEKAAARNAHWVSFGERLWWIVATAAIGAVGLLWKGGGG